MRNMAVLSLDISVELLFFSHFCFRVFVVFLFVLMSILLFLNAVISLS